VQFGFRLIHMYCRRCDGGEDCVDASVCQRIGRIPEELYDGAFN
jgi:hypothetical protein